MSRLRCTNIGRAGRMLDGRMQDAGYKIQDTRYKKEG